MIPAAAGNREAKVGRFQDIPIRSKLYLIIALAVGFAILVAAGAVLIYENSTFRPRAQEKAETQSRIVAELLVPPLLFNDSATCATYLGMLRYWPEITEASLYDSTWSVFTYYRRDKGSAPHLLQGHTQTLGATFTPSRLIYARPVLDANRLLGYLVLRLELPPLLARLPQYGIMFTVVMLSLLAVAGMLAFALKYGITAPLTVLAGTVKAVTEKKDYKLRAPTGGRDEVGSLTQAFNQMLDTLEQHEFSLSENRYLLQSIIDNSTAVIYVKDLDGRYLLINRRYEDLFHITNESIRGKTDLELFPQDAAETCRANDLKALTAGHALEFEEVIPHGDGAHTYISIKCPLRDAEGRLYAICGISTDITQIKTYEARLRQSQKMEAIGQLAGGIAHDFNNLLTAINGYSSLALEGMDSTHPLHPFIVEIFKAGQRAANLTRQLLAYSRKQVLEAKTWNLNEIVSDMEKMLNGLIGENVVLHTRLAADLGSVRVDRSQVEQIILNLAINARDAMPRGGMLTMETKNVFLDSSYAAIHPEAVSGKYVLLAVSDSGIGMTQENIAHIFEPFFTTKEVGKGTGLGLSVVYGIVNQSGGSISVRSEPGEGATFCIYLPEIPAAAGSTGETGSPSANQAAQGNETILLVEDEEQVRNFSKHTLEAQGYQVLAAGNGVEALKAVAGHAGPPHMLITDVVMPNMGGAELAERIGKMFPEIPILFISGYAEMVPQTTQTNGTKIKSVGSLLQKPFGPSDLTRKVRDSLDKAKSKRKA